MVVRLLTTLSVLLTVGIISGWTGVARADRLCSDDGFVDGFIEPPRPLPTCTGEPEDDDSCRDGSPGAPLPAAAVILSGKTSLNLSAAPVLGPPSARLLARILAQTGGPADGHARRIDRPPRLLRFR